MGAGRVSGRAAGCGGGAVRARPHRAGRHARLHGQLGGAGRFPENAARAGRRRTDPSGPPRRIASIISAPTSCSRRWSLPTASSASRTLPTTPRRRTATTPTRRASRACAPIRRRSSRWRPIWSAWRASRRPIRCACWSAPACRSRAGPGSIRSRTSWTGSGCWGRWSARTARGGAGGRHRGAARRPRTPAGARVSGARPLLRSAELHDGAGDAGR